jgi:Deacetylase PdaC/Protein of unknown function (DUF3298)
MQKYILFALLITIGCKSKVENPIADNVLSGVNAIQYDSIVISKTFGNPDTSIGFSEFALRIPVLKNGDSLICKRINDSIYQFILNAITEITWEENTVNYKGKDYYQIADLFTNVIGKAPKKKEEDYNNAQSFNYNGSILYRDSSKLTIAFEFYSYAGGAHGFGGEIYKNFSLKDGSALNIKDYVIDTTIFKSLVKSDFFASRKEFALKEKMEYNPNGYFWDNGFALPENIGFTPKGMIFNYLPYEAASYAEGNLTFEIPYSKLKGVIKL